MCAYNLVTQGRMNRICWLNIVAKWWALGLRRDYFSDNNVESDRGKWNLKLTSLFHMNGYRWACLHMCTHMSIPEHVHMRTRGHTHTHKQTHEKEERGGRERERKRERERERERERMRMHMCVHKPRLSCGLRITLRSLLPLWVSQGLNSGGQDGRRKASAFTHLVILLAHSLQYF